jgi:hypothetical protein
LPCGFVAVVQSAIVAGESAEYASSESYWTKGE